MVSIHHDNNTTIISAGLVLPAADQLPRRGWAVAVSGDRIVADGPLATVRERFPTAAEASYPDLLMLPTLVNAHDHGRGLGPAALGLADDLLEPWQLSLSGLPALDPYTAAAYDGLRLLRSGVSMVVHCHRPRNWARLSEEVSATLRGYAAAGIRVALHIPYGDLGQPVYAEADHFLSRLPPAVGAMALAASTSPPLDRADYLALCADLLRAHHDPQSQAVHIQIGLAGGLACSDELLGAAADLARRYATRLHMPALETRYQSMAAYRRWGHSLSRQLERLDVLGPWLTLAHMVWTDRDDWPLLGERGVAVAYCPSSNIRLRSGIMALADAARSQVQLGIGLNGLTIDEDQEYWRELRLAWALSNRPGADEPTLRAEDLFHIATAGGAMAAAGPQFALGKLATGGLADLQLVEPPPNLADEPALLSTLIRSTTRANVRHVLVGGRWRVRDGLTANLDEPALLAELWAQAATPPDAQRRQATLAAQALGPYLRRFYAAWENDI